jgi:hypothetical protein
MENKPTYDISTSVNDNIFEIVFTGEVTEDCDNKLQGEVISINN